MEDNYRHKGMRKQMVDELRQKGITDESVLKAIETVPRHLFLDKAFLERAYQNKPFPIGKGQTISHPFTVAYQSELLQIKSGEKVLEIGTGSGYQACILDLLGAKVYSIERHEVLFQKSRDLIKKLGFNKIRCFYGDGFEGLPGFAPFDKIIITAAAPIIPDKLLQQLAIGGKMVIPLGEGNKQKMLRLTKTSDHDYAHEAFEDFLFVPMLQGTEK
ncbi:MAG: protein-L-isoaspartate(D-aspartate) O-methyltransferase [Chitinophagales bacterium]|nr:protein-L-isoaspartate(D-aspartate) O-methyltransferase [Chitinophagales bacterium]